MTSMREWGAKHPGLKATLVGAAVGAIILVASLITGGGLDDALANAIFYGLLLGGGLFFVSQGFRETAAPLAGNGQALMFLRYPGAPPGSLRGTWETGIASTDAGWINFQPAVHDTLAPTGRSKALTGLRVVSPPRRPQHKDTQQGLPPGFRIMNLDSDGGAIEIAASPATLRKIQDAAGSAGP